MDICCLLTATSDVEHLQQIYADYHLLHQKGLLNLKLTVPSEFLQNKSNPERWIDYNFFNTIVVINNKIRVCYDTHDWNWIDESVLRGVDFYFKRSYDEKYLAQLDEKHKVFPLGLNYQVSSDTVDLFRLKRAAFYAGRDKIKLVLKALRIDNFLPNSETERLDLMESAPNFAAEPKILFMARAWNTETILNQTQKEIVGEINQTRAESIRLLRR